jgi:hypothetical protein
MIFLAVTPGFFAETLREKISENSQATELAKNLSKGSFYLYRPYPFRKAFFQFTSLGLFIIPPMPEVIPLKAAL